MKLLYVSPAYAPAWTFGGVVASWHRMLKEIASQGDDVTVFTTDAGQPSREQGVQTGYRVMSGVKVHYFKGDWKNPILSRSLNAEIKRRIGEFDLMHLAGVWQPISIGARRAAVASGCPYVVSLHGALDPWPMKQKRLKKLIYYQLAERKNIELAAGIRYTSKMESESSSRFAKQGQEQRIIPNGIDFAAWYHDTDAGKQWRAEVGIPADRFLYLSVGRLHRIKGLELAVRALAPMRERSWHLAFIGEDEDGTGSALAGLAADLGLADKVSFHDSVSQNKLPTIYSAGDLFLLPSHHENFGNVVLESLACACPVLVSDEVAIARDLNGIRGVGVRKLDLSSWSEALTGALDGKEEFRAELSDRGELERRFSIGHCARRMREFHQSVLAQSRSVCSK